MINDNCCGRHPPQGAVFAQDDFANIVVIADAAEDDFSAFCSCGWCLRLAPTELFTPINCCARRPVVYDDDVSIPGKVPCHRKTHSTEPDICYAHNHSPQEETVRLRGPQTRCNARASLGVRPR